VLSSVAMGGRNKLQLKWPALHEALGSGTQAAQTCARTRYLRCQPANNDKAEGWSFWVPLPPFMHVFSTAVLLCNGGVCATAVERVRADCSVQSLHDVDVRCWTQVALGIGLDDEYSGQGEP
jgi:hypothetical protein